MTSSVRSIRKILVPSDLQSDSRNLLSTAARMARAADAEVILLHVVEVDPPEGMAGPALESFSEQTREEARRALQLQAETLAGKGVRLAPLRNARGGQPHLVIREAIEDAGADLVVMHSRARSGKGHRIGSTADRLLRTSPVPVLILKGEETLPTGKVAVLTDFSARSHKAALQLVKGLPALVRGDEGEEPVVELVHVCDHRTRIYDPLVADLIEEKLEGEAAKLRNRLEVGIRVRARLLWGDHPVDEVVETASAQGYGLLVAGTHGGGPIRRALIGSVAMGLSQTARVPVLVVPP